MDDLKLIKKYYGEKMMHLCRKLFPTLLDNELYEEGTLFKLISDNFAYNKYLYDDLISDDELLYNFQKYIYGFVLGKKERVVTDKNPYELLREAGYQLYECKSEEDIQKFSKYYEPREKLCTFNGGRLKTCHVFFAVKDNALELNRDYFTNPERQDEYGTSVISIQFSRGDTNILSIKNRYNHTVKAPDSTFSNNLDNIIPGLTYAFEKEYHLNISGYDEDISYIEEFNYVKANDNKFYKYNLELNNIYYCLDNIIIDSFDVVNKYHDNSERYILFDYFILDIKEKKMFVYDKYVEDSFLDVIGDIKSVNICKEKDNKNIIIKNDKDITSIIKISKIGNFISFKNDSIDIIEDNFLCYDEDLMSIDIPNVKKIGNDFLLNNYDLININAPLVEEVGNSFLYYNEKLEYMNTSLLNKVGHSFLEFNENFYFDNKNKRR